MLEVRDLRFAYGKNEPLVLDGVTMQAEKGCITAVLGKNGAGKSTLIRCIDGILKPQGGSVLLDGEKLADLSRRELARRLAYVPQNPGNGELTVFETVLLGRRPYIRWGASPGDRKLVLDTLRALSLEKLQLRPMGELSGGEAQKVLIARALVQQPKVLLFDEPTSNLDPLNQHEMLRLVDRIVKEENISAVCVMHDLNLAARWCSRFVMLREGKVFASGGPETLDRENIRAVYGMETERIEHRGVPVLIPLIR